MKERLNVSLRTISAFLNDSYETDRLQWDVDVLSEFVTWINYYSKNTYEELLDCVSQVDKALLVVAYPTGMPADVLPLDREQCRHYWQLWLQRLQQFHRARDAAQGASS